MATRHQRGEAVPAGKQKVAAGADGRNRRVLGDIGNLVNLGGPDGKPVYQINRPVTRSFGAQLLANAQAAAAANKKPVAVGVDVAVAKDAAKVAKQKQTSKPSKPEAVITISPDTEEEKKHAEPKISHRNSTKKKVQTLTSVLTARSKVACGIVDKPKVQVEDIDAVDADNQLAVVDYVEDIYKFYKLAESSSRPHDYIDSQIEINAKMRAILADWLIEVHNKFELMPETLYLTFYIMDKYLSMETVFRRELQLVGVSAMLIACKYEEIWAPEVNDFICISDRAYSREEILAKEKVILNKLEWHLTVPTPYVFLVRFLKAAALCDKEMEHMVFFLSELALMHYPMIMYCPSIVAASAVYVARCTLNKSPLWSETLKRHTGFTETQLLDCAKVLVELHSTSSVSKLKVVYKKYSSPDYEGVALLSPATKVVEEMKKLEITSRR
ncbi:G2/mitotic-specific cyclin S13-7-like [Dioscorea cayenensis subsp. rotundata]|uniref:G2/mitotic-specific cyclin S13-7-like n=1 Tax=Dioscorea cayennensis subsp. rotundata TaxID=55577 RepID=A0AB40BL90_DIOCR|nr:G2/mitotic-specific cyclin S13-7-like [Dioscorea cayenensis subsp. rotundata]